MRATPNEALVIDARKVSLETKGARELKKVFGQMAIDAGNLIRLTGRIDSRVFAQNYEPDFIKVEKDILRATVDDFSKDLRKEAKSRGDLDLTTKNIDILYTKQEIEGDQELIDETLEQEGSNIVTQFNAEMSVYINNTAEEQAALITDTNVNMVGNAFLKAERTWLIEQTKLTNDSNNLATQISALAFALSTTPSSRDQRELEKLQATLDSNNDQLNILQEDSNIFIGDLTEENINQAGEARSELIAEQTVGFAESEVREAEATLISEAALQIVGGAILLTTKTWVAILDGRTRPAHVSADGQVVPLISKFTVGGEQLTRPRDPNGSLANIMRCRCIAIYKLITLQINDQF